MNRISLIWNHLRATFWFMPSLIVFASSIAAILFIHLDAQDAGKFLPDWPLLFDASPDGARVMLSTIAASMMTVVGVIYSMILVTLSLAASQYSSRIIRNFMRDRSTQIVLGVFTGIFVYCLFVLRVIPGDGDDAFVPILAVTFGVILALCAVGLLIYFIHHIAASIQASSVIEAASRETLLAIDRQFPRPEDFPARTPTIDTTQRLWHPVHADRHGYIQSVNTHALVAIAVDTDSLIRMERAIGDFLVPGEPIASIACDPRPTEDLVSRVQTAYTLNGYRTVEQDPAYGIQQIVDIALRALSPGINDTNTATMCVDHLSACIARLATRAEPHPALPIDDTPRLFCTGHSFQSMLDDAIDQIRESAEGNAAILIRMLNIIETAARLTTHHARQSHLSSKLEAIAEAARRSITPPTDLQRFKHRYSEVLSILTARG